MNIEAVRRIAEREEIDYQFLLSTLSDYSRPRDKITAWLQSGDLIRVKKGLYVFGKHIALTAYSSECLANLIYGPSAISLSYALSFYGFIPERVTTITSITNKRNKSFATPVGEFTYHYLAPTKYPLDILLSGESGSNFLIASPEKALCDHIHLTDKHVILKNLDSMSAYLLHDMRIDEEALRSLKLKSLTAICQIYTDTRLDLLRSFIQKWKR